jgi:hypothetical protein
MDWIERLRRLTCLDQQKMIGVRLITDKSPLGELDNMMKRRPFWALLAVGMTAVSTGVVNAQSTVSSVGMLGEFGKKSIVGSWLETVTFPPGAFPPPQKAMVSFHADGTEAASGEGGVILGAPPNLQTGSVNSDSFGAWAQLDWRSFAYTDEAVLSDLSGNLTGFFKVRGIYKLDASGDKYTGNSYYEFLDTDMRPVIDPTTKMPFAGWVTNVGKRIPVELPPPK